MKDVDPDLQTKDVDASLQTNDVDANCLPGDEFECDPFDNDEEYVGVDDENTYGLTVPITVTEEARV
jgi:hypothetical protein